MILHKMAVMHGVMYFLNMGKLNPREGFLIFQTPYAYGD